MSNTPATSCTAGRSRGQVRPGQLGPGCSCEGLWAEHESRGTVCPAARVPSGWRGQRLAGHEGSGGPGRLTAQDEAQLLRERDRAADPVIGTQTHLQAQRALRIAAELIRRRLGTAAWRVALNAVHMLHSSARPSATPAEHLVIRRSTANCVIDERYWTLSTAA